MVVRFLSFCSSYGCCLCCSCTAGISSYACIHSVVRFCCWEMLCVGGKLLCIFPSGIGCKRRLRGSRTGILRWSPIVSCTRFASLWVSRCSLLSEVLLRLLLCLKVLLWLLKRFLKFSEHLSTSAPNFSSTLPMVQSKTHPSYIYIYFDLRYILFRPLRSLQCSWLNEAPYMYICRTSWGASKQQGRLAKQICRQESPRVGRETTQIFDRNNALPANIMLLVSASWALWWSLHHANALCKPTQCLHCGLSTLAWCLP